MESEETLNNCPHCGAKLSPWQKVLLNVDRAIMCKSCWYRIILSPESSDTDDPDSKVKKEKRGKNGNL